MRFKYPQLACCCTTTTSSIREVKEQEEANSFSSKNNSNLEAKEEKEELDEVNHMPDIAAGEDAFGSGGLAHALSYLGAFFVRRNTGGAPDPELQATIHRLLSTSSSPLIEAFLEGRRSRDRRYLPARTGLLRCLLKEASKQGRSILILPLTISYEVLPEQGMLADDLHLLAGPIKATRSNDSSHNGRVMGLMAWATRVLRGKVVLGSAWIKAGEAIHISPSYSSVEPTTFDAAKASLSSVSVITTPPTECPLGKASATPTPIPLAVNIFHPAQHRDIAEAIQKEQRAATVVSEEIHLMVASQDFGIEVTDLKRLCQAVGVEVMEKKRGALGGCVKLPIDPTQRWMLHLQWLGGGSGKLAGWVGQRLPFWGVWLKGGRAAQEMEETGYVPTLPDDEVEERTERVVNVLCIYFERMSSRVQEAVRVLRERGFVDPSPTHVLQYCNEERSCSNATRRISVVGTPTTIATADNNTTSIDPATTGTTPAVTITTMLPIQLIHAALTEEAMKKRRNESKEEEGREKVLVSEASTVDVEEGNGSLFPPAPPSAAGYGIDDEALHRVKKMDLIQGQRRGRLMQIDDDDEEEGGEEEEEELGSWGFRDSKFTVIGEAGGDTVMMTGQRYALSGRRLPGLLRFFGAELGVSLSAQDIWLSSPPSRLSAPFLIPLSILNKLTAICPVKGQVSTRGKDRCRHGVGHALEDVVNLRLGRISRMPDVVVQPDNERQVEALVKLAKEDALCLVPYGGGTNVSLALKCPEQEERPIVSVDMRRMNWILWVNEEDGIAEIEAGMVGRHLQEALATWGSGWTLGHEPDSAEFSTLGGWIATKASGMKRSRYGNIEDLVLGVRLATSHGLASQGYGRDYNANTGGEGSTSSSSSCRRPHHVGHSRVSHGLDLRHLALGSEGGLGIITSAIVRIRPLPTSILYDSALFPHMEAGLTFMRAISRLPVGLRPASVRLMDNTQFRLGRVLAGGSDGGLMKMMKHMYIVQWKGYDLSTLLGATLVYEGSEKEVLLQKQEVGRLVTEVAGGMMTGAAAGRTGYELTLSIAYLRDFGLNHYVLGESLEAFVGWSKVDDVIQRVMRRARKDYAQQGLEGKPLISCRVTQIYDEGVCLYIYLAIYARGLRDPCLVYRRLEKGLREEILACGGSVSHHHGIGKAKAALLEEQTTPAALQVFSQVKKAMDPQNIFGARNGLLVVDSSKE